MKIGMKKLKTDPRVIAEYKTKVALVVASLIGSGNVGWINAIEVAMRIIDEVDAAVDAELADTPAKAGL